MREGPGGVKGARPAVILDGGRAASAPDPPIAAADRARERATASEEWAS